MTASFRKPFHLSATFLTPSARGSLSAQTSVISSFTASVICAQVLTFGGLWMPFSLVWIISASTAGSGTFACIQNSLEPDSDFRGGVAWASRNAVVSDSGVRMNLSSSQESSGRLAPVGMPKPGALPVNGMPLAFGDGGGGTMPYLKLDLSKSSW